MTLKKNLDPKETICRDLWAYPVIDLSKPRVRTCCKRGVEYIDKKIIEKNQTNIFLNLPSVINDRLELLNGNQVNGCKSCWELENNNQKSFRLGHLDFQFHFNNENGDPIHWSKFRSFEKLIEEKEDILYSNMPNKLDIQLGSYCDQKCIYCNHSYSTQWETEDVKFGRIDKRDPERPMIVKNILPIIETENLNWFNLFLDWFDQIYGHLERIALLGGEPTVSPQFESLIDYITSKLKLNSHPNCTLVIVTNLNWRKPILEKIKKIREELPNNIKLILEISMESSHQRAEYIRFGINWNRFLYNLNSIATLKNIEIKLCVSLNGLCITSIQSYFELIKKIEIENNKNFQVIANRIIYPKWLSTSILDVSFEDYVNDFVFWLESNYNETEIINKLDLYIMMKNLLLEIQKPTDKNLLGFFTKWIDAIDQRRNTKFLKIFPEFSNLYNSNKIYGQRSFTDIEIREWQF